MLSIPIMLLKAAASVALAAAPHGGPAMYWYGWLATAFLGALAVSAVALAVPERWAARAWPALSWIVPTAAILVVAFLLRGYFIR